jgi:hypothetical protein
MQLCMKDGLQGHATAVRLLLQTCCKDSSVTRVAGSDDLKLVVDGAEITGVNAICKAIAMQSCASLLGGTPERTAQVRLRSTQLFDGQRNGSMTSISRDAR